MEESSKSSKGSNGSNGSNGSEGSEGSEGSKGSKGSKIPLELLSAKCVDIPPSYCSCWDAISNFWSLVAFSLVLYRSSEADLFTPHFELG